MTNTDRVQNGVSRGGSAESFSPTLAAERFLDTSANGWLGALCSGVPKIRNFVVSIRRNDYPGGAQQNRYGLHVYLLLGIKHV
jgi:hypothetical protein